jgi:hypothetical protein
MHTGWAITGIITIIAIGIIITVTAGNFATTV